MTTLTRACCCSAGTTVCFVRHRASPDESVRFIEEFRSTARRRRRPDDSRRGRVGAGIPCGRATGRHVAELDRHSTPRDHLPQCRRAVDARSGSDRHGSLASLLGDDQRALEIQAEVFDLANEPAMTPITLQSLVAKAMTGSRSVTRKWPTTIRVARAHVLRDYPYFDSVAYTYEAGAGAGDRRGRSETAGRLLGAPGTWRDGRNAARMWPLLQPQRDQSRRRSRPGSALTPWNSSAPKAQRGPPPIRCPARRARPD